jgi:short-subunit dehydrogenase
MALEMAKKGMNILLISRTEAKLQETQDAIATKCPKVGHIFIAILAGRGFEIWVADQREALGNRLLQL